MKRNNMYFDTQRAKLYKDIYRPSSNLSRFLKTIMTIILEGHSPLSGTTYYYTKKKK
jgi:hypothetical protein